MAFQTQLFPLQALPSVKQFPPFAVSPTLTPPSFRLPRIAIMNQCENTETSINQDTTHKSALSFILSSSDSETDIDKIKNSKRGLSSEATTTKRRRTVGSTSSVTAGLTSKPQFKKGSKFCFIEGCTSRAKHAKRCWKHGGWVRCKVPDCNNRAKSKGVCWSHGGGTVCVFVSCDTIAVSNGVCWAHGGGKRCQVPNCSKPAYERTQNYCQTHYEKLSAIASS